MKEKPRNVFWIKLARLSALLERIDRHRAALDAIARNPTFKLLDDESQVELSKLAHSLEELSWFD